MHYRYKTPRRAKMEERNKRNRREIGENPADDYRSTYHQSYAGTTVSSLIYRSIKVKMTYMQRTKKGKTKDRGTKEGRSYRTTFQLQAPGYHRQRAMYRTVHVKEGEH